MPNDPTEGITTSDLLGIPAEEICKADPVTFMVEGEEVTETGRCDCETETSK